MIHMYAGDHASRCRCQSEIGDYSNCPRHGDNSEWAKEQERKDKLANPPSRGGEGA